MSSITRYYDVDKAFVPYYALHLAIKNHFANTFFSDDIDRIVYTQNNNALRKRMDHITNNIQDSSTNTTEVNQSTLRPDTYVNFPFMNYKRTDWNSSDSFNRWNFQAFQDGIYVPSIGQKIKLAPTRLTFSGLIWTSSENDLVAARRLFTRDKDNFTEVDYSIKVGDCDIPMWSDLRYSNLDYDPEFDDKTWLDQNNIHTIAFSFEVYFYDAFLNSPDDGSFSLTEEVIYNYKVKNNLGDITDEEVYRFIQDELNP